MPRWKKDAAVSKQEDQIPCWCNGRIRRVSPFVPRCQTLTIWKKKYQNKRRQDRGKVHPRSGRSVQKRNGVCWYIWSTVIIQQTGTIFEKVVCSTRQLPHRCYNPQFFGCYTERNREKRIEITQKEFRIILSEQLLSQGNRKRKRENIRWMEDFHLPIKVAQSKKCSCGCNSNTPYRCLTCGCSLVASHFYEYHKNLQRVEDDENAQWGRKKTEGGHKSSFPFY